MDQTYELSEILGRGQEISDGEFALLVGGDLQYLPANRLLEIVRIVETEPWKSVYEEHRKYDALDEAESARRDDARESFLRRYSATQTEFR